MKPFSFNKEKVKREETEAYKAFKEIDQILHDGQSGAYRPWQFEGYEVEAISMKTTYDELFILWKEETRFRQGFKVGGIKISIPTIFAKINGTHKNIKVYWDQLDQLRGEQENTVFIPNIPFSSPVRYSVDRSLLDHRGLFIKEKVQSMREYSLTYLKTSLQHLMLDKLNELIATEDFFQFPITDEVKFKALYRILNLEEEYLKLLQKFDYPFQNPKVVVLDRNKNIFSQEDILLLGFLHLMGLDIAVFTPTGYNNLENGINEQYYDVHRLEEIQYNLPLNNKIRSNLPVSSTKRITAGILGIFLGAFGIHKFYLGRPWQGVLRILFCWTLIPSILGIIEGIVYLKGNDPSFSRKIRPRNRTTAGILAIIFGVMGVHKFYLGRVWQGLVYLALAATGISFVLGIIDGIKYLKLSDQDFDAIYYEG